MKIYYNKFKESFPEISKEDYERIYNYLEHEGFISTTARGLHEIYTFYKESLKNYEGKNANKCAEMDTASMFNMSTSRVRQIKLHFVKNYKPYSS